MTRPIDRLRTASIRFQPKSPDASVARVRRLAGIITLTEPVPDPDLLEKEDTSTEERACRPVSDQAPRTSPIGTPAAEAASRRAATSEAYRAECARLEPFERVARQVMLLRAQHGLTQRQLAKRVGTSHSQISRIESGQHKANLETLRRIAEAFELDLVTAFEPRSHASGATPRDLRAGRTRSRSRAGAGPSQASPRLRQSIPAEPPRGS
jgi:transcriptional regulator with XRE-family HTH domain